MKYIVEIEEILHRMVEVDATCKDEAEMQVRQLYRDSMIVLSADDFIGKPTIKVLNYEHNN